MDTIFDPLRKIDVARTPEEEVRQALWENLLANEEISSCLELSPEGPQAQEGEIAFWTQWNGDLI